MVKAGIFEQVREVVSEILGVGKDEIKRSSHLANDLGADSLDMVELVTALEEEFAKELDEAGMNGIPDQDTEEMETVQDICSYIEGKLY